MMLERVAAERWAPLRAEMREKTANDIEAPGARGETTMMSGVESDAASTAACAESLRRGEEAFEAATRGIEDEVIDLSRRYWQGGDTASADVARLARLLALPNAVDPWTARAAGALIAAFEMKTEHFDTHTCNPGWLVFEDTRFQALISLTIIAMQEVAKIGARLERERAAGDLAAE